MNLVEKKYKEIAELCLKYQVKSLYVFGSILTENFTKKSDIDLIVDINNNDPFAYADNYFSLKFQLEALLKRKIDLLENKAIKNKYFKQEIDKTKVLIYGA